MNANEKANKNILVTGASGYIGGSVAHLLTQRGFQVAGLVRSDRAASAVAARGVRPIIATLDDRDALAEAARGADAVIHTADADHRGAAETLVAALRGTGKALIHTSGSSIVADDARGEPSDSVYDDETPFEPVPEKAARVAIDRLVLGSAAQDVRAVVVCPTMVYGRGLGPKHDSVQVPMLTREAERRGIGRHIGRGANVWSNVHIQDLTDLYVRALERAPAGSFFFAENGETSLASIAAAISRKLGLGGGTETWPLEEAIAAVGDEAARFGLASNSRVRARRARALLGWSPVHTSLVDDLERAPA